MTPVPDSPQNRLTASRKALVRQMMRVNGRLDDDLQDNFQGSTNPAANGDRSTERGGAWQLFTQAVANWWQHHPLQIAVDVGKPFLNSFARDKPLQLRALPQALVQPWC